MNKLVDTIDNHSNHILPQSSEAIRNRRNRLLIPAGTMALSALLYFGGEAVINANSAPEFSPTTTTYTIKPGESIYTAAEHIKGDAAISQDSAVNYIEHLPVNHEVLEDGLQPGEQVTIPKSVTK